VKPGGMHTDGGRTHRFFRQEGRHSQPEMEV
jgi:hypothetical protein